MTYYEKGEHFVQERHTRNGVSRETLDEEQWQRGQPVYVRTERLNDGNRSESFVGGAPPPSARLNRARIPAERMLDDYRRIDYAYEDDGAFSIRRPQSIHSSFRDNDHRDSKIYTIRNGSRSEFNSPNADRASQAAVSRPGSPGPVAGAGDIINTEHGFTIQLDVKHFRPEEIKVVLNDDLLCVSGERIEESADGQTLRRSFSRKYSIPSDIHLDSIRSHLADSGFLIINGSRRGWKETNISMHSVHQPRRSGSVISTV